MIVGEEQVSEVILKGDTAKWLLSEWNICGRRYWYEDRSVEEKQGMKPDMVALRE